MSKSKKNAKNEIPSYADTLDRARDDMKRGIAGTVQNPENYIGQYVVVHSAPTAWIGCLVNIERRDEAIGCVLADSGLWINGELKEVIRPGLKASKDTDSSHHHVTYVPIVTALQPAGSPSTLTWKPTYQGRRPGDPSKITLENYAEASGQDVDSCVKALQNAHQQGNKGFDNAVNMVAPFADEVAFPAPAVASLLISDALSRCW